MMLSKIIRNIKTMYSLDYKGKYPNPVFMIRRSDNPETGLRPVSELLKLFKRILHKLPLVFFKYFISSYALEIFKSLE